MPIRVSYSDPALLGRLAVQAGRGDDFWRRYQAGQQQVAAQRSHNLASAEAAQRAFALQTAARNRPMPGGGVHGAGPGVTSMPGGGQIVRNPFAEAQEVVQNTVSPEQIKLQQFQEHMKSMLGRGTIDPQEADRAVARYMAGDRTPFDPPPTPGDVTERERFEYRQQADIAKKQQEQAEMAREMELARIRSRRKAAEAEQDRLERLMENTIDVGALGGLEQQIEGVAEEIQRTYRDEQNLLQVDGGGAAGDPDAPQEGEWREDEDGSLWEYKGGKWWKRV